MTTADTLLPFIVLCSDCGACGRGDLSRKGASLPLTCLAERALTKSG